MDSLHAADIAVMASPLTSGESDAQTINTNDTKINVRKESTSARRVRKPVRRHGINECYT